MGEYFGAEVKQFLKYFKIPLAICGVVAVIFMIISATHPYTDGMHVSHNNERVYGDQRVFDYGDQLSSAEEEKLEAYIHDAEKETGLDIVIVTLNQSLSDYAPEYAAKYTQRITPDKYVMVYADKFWEDNKFGFNCPQRLDGRTDSGDGILLVDNVFREPETGKIYTWMCTTGLAEEKYSSSAIDSALDTFYEYVEDDYYRACIAFVNSIKRKMGPSHLSKAKWPFVVAVIFFLIYYSGNSQETPGNKSTSATSYLLSNRSSFSVCEDIFVDKTVTRHYNPPSSSSSGGGGHHSSGGGGSHGGGGHSR